MSYSKETEFRWFTDKGTEMILQVYYEMSYDSCHGSFQLDCITCIKFDDPFGSEVEWDNVLRTFRPELINAIEAHIEDCIDRSSNNFDEINNARIDHESGLADYYYEMYRDER